MVVIEVCKGFFAHLCPQTFATFLRWSCPYSEKLSGAGLFMYRSHHLLAARRRRSAAYVFAHCDSGPSTNRKAATQREGMGHLVR